MPGRRNAKRGDLKSLRDTVSDKVVTGSKAPEIEKGVQGQFPESKGKEAAPPQENAFEVETKTSKKVKEERERKRARILNDINAAIMKGGRVRVIE